MMSEWNGDWEGDNNRAYSWLLELFTVCFNIPKKTRSQNLSKSWDSVYLHQESFLYLFSNVWLKWNWQSSKLKNTTNLERKYGALSIQPKPRLLNFRQLPVANRAAFSKVSIKEDNLAWYTQIFVTFSRKFFFHSTLLAEISRNFGWVVRISEIQPFPGFLETCPENFCTICRCFQNFESSGWMEGAYGVRVMHSISRAFFNKGKALGTSVEEFAIIGNLLAFKYFSAYVII